MANQWIFDALSRVHFEFKFQTSYAMIITAYTGMIAAAKTPAITAQFFKIDMTNASSEVLTCYLRK